MPTTQLTSEEKIALRAMMPRCHYPNRTKKFEFGDSEVVQFIMKQFGVTLPRAIRVFETARHAKHIVYDPTARLWMGCELMEPAPSTEANEGASNE